MFKPAITRPGPCSKCDRPAYHIERKGLFTIYHHDEGPETYAICAESVVATS